MTSVERGEVPVLFRRVGDDVPAIQSGWAEVEAAVGRLRGRKFYGAFLEAKAEYWVCVQRQPDDDPAALGLEEGVLPGGTYVRERLKGEPPAVYDLIAPTFQRMAAEVTVDPERPSLEFYRERDVIDLLLPVQ